MATTRFDRGSGPPERVIPAVCEGLLSELVLWLSSTRPDGRPHVVPTWFDWDGEAITVFSKPHAQKVRNVRHQRLVMVAIGRPEHGFNVDLLEGEASLEVTGVRRPSRRFQEKYRDALGEAGYTLEAFAAEYPQSVRIRPTRLLDWGVRGQRRMASRAPIAERSL